MLIAPHINATLLTTGVNNHALVMLTVNLVITVIAMFAVLLLLQRAAKLVNVAIGVMVKLV